MKALGKKPPFYCACVCGQPNCAGDIEQNADHYRQALIEAADELDKAFDWDIADLRKMSKKLRISAGVK
jgi:hypothetical protein